MDEKHQYEVGYINCRETIHLHNAIRQSKCRSVSVRKIEPVELQDSYLSSAEKSLIAVFWTLLPIWHVRAAYEIKRLFNVCELVFVLSILSCFILDGKNLFWKWRQPMHWRQLPGEDSSNFWRSKLDEACSSSSIFGKHLMNESLKWKTVCRRVFCWVVALNSGDLLIANQSSVMWLKQTRAESDPKFSWIAEWNIKPGWMITSPATSQPP